MQMTDVQIDNYAQIELERLQKSFRLMENDKEAFSDDVKKIVFKQKIVLKHLEREKKELETLLGCADNKALSKRESNVLKQLKDQLKEYEEIEDAIKKESQNLVELEEKIENIEKDEFNLKQKFQIPESDIEIIKKQEKIDENLETRLYVEKVKFNKLITENQKLREEINHLLSERGKFNGMFQQLVGKLNSGKKVLMDLIEQSTNAFDKREEAFTKLEALRQRAKQDLMLHSQEMRELKRRLDYETKLHDFVGAKGAKRINLDIENYKEAKKQLGKELMEVKLQNFKKIMENIKRVFNETDVERLAASFLKLEEDNYNIFSFINELNKEQGVLREQSCEIKVKIEEQREENKKIIEEQNVHLMELQENLEVATEEANKAKNDYQQCQIIIQNVLEGVQAVFRFIQCDPTPILQLLGDNTLITSQNCMLYLDMIERRVMDIVELIWYLSYSKVAARAAKLFPGQVSQLREPVMKSTKPAAPKILTSDKVVPTQPCPLCIEQNDISEVDESIAVPLNKKEIEDHVKDVMFSSEFEERLHNVSTCRLPKSRRIMQRRFQN